MYSENPPGKKFPVCSELQAEYFRCHNNNSQNMEHGGKQKHDH